MLLEIIAVIPFFIAGAVGALLSDVLADNALVLPKILAGKFELGFIGAVFIGGCVGSIVDGSLLPAFLGGFTGRGVLDKLAHK